MWMRRKNRASYRELILSYRAGDRVLYPIKRIETENYESRRGYKPLIIVNHITDGEYTVRQSDEHEENAVRNTFCSPSEGASATFVIQRDGEIEQYVPLEYAPWTNGVHDASEIQASKSPIVRQMGVNPNLYSITKEYIGYAGHGGDGSITEEQFWAGVWVDKWSQTEVMRMYGHKIPLNSTYEMGHCHVAPKSKPYCPGRNFPWTRIYTELAIADSMSLEDYEGRIQMMRSPQYQVTKYFQIGNEVQYLYDLSKLQDSVGDWARKVLRSLFLVFESRGVLTDKYSDTDDFKQFWNDVTWLYDCARGIYGPEKVNDGIWALSQAYPYMLQNGLVPA